MAQRYSGKYSPAPDPQTQNDPARPFEKARVDPVGARANVMFVPAIPMVFLALNDGAAGLIVALMSAAILTAGAYMLREGLRAEAAFVSRKVSRRPALPRKIAAACLAGIGIALAAYRNEPGFAAPLLYGLATCGLHLAAFGVDPLRSKGLEGIDSFQQDRVARVVDGAEAVMRDMTDAMKRASDRKMEVRLEQFQTTVRDLIRTVEEDPRDLTAARKYLSVYLIGSPRRDDQVRRYLRPQPRRASAARLCRPAGRSGTELCRAHPQNAARRPHRLDDRNRRLARPFAARRRKVSATENTSK